MIERLAKALYVMGFAAAVIIGALASFQIIGSTPEAKIVAMIVALSCWALGWTAKWILLGRWL
jgi:hypothetical protein